MPWVRQAWEEMRCTHPEITPRGGDILCQAVLTTEQRAPRPQRKWIHLRFAGGNPLFNPGGTHSKEWENVRS